MRDSIILFSCLGAFYSAVVFDVLSFWFICFGLSINQSGSGDSQYQDDRCRMVLPVLRFMLCFCQECFLTTFIKRILGLLLLPAIIYN